MVCKKKHRDQKILNGAQANAFKNNTEMLPSKVTTMKCLYPKAQTLLSVSKTPRAGWLITCVNTYLMIHPQVHLTLSRHNHISRVGSTMSYAE